MTDTKTIWQLFVPNNVSIAVSADTAAGQGDHIQLWRCYIVKRRSTLRLLLG